MHVAGRPIGRQICVELPDLSSGVSLRAFRGIFDDAYEHDLLHIWKFAGMSMFMRESGR